MDQSQHQTEHQWATFYSPRNGRISIQACNICGLAKGFVAGQHECTEVTPEKKETRLRGWTTESGPKDPDHSLDIG